MGTSGDLACVPPQGWSRVEVARPLLDASPAIAVDRWEAWGSPTDASARLLAGCFGRDLGTWTSEATPIVLERLAATIAAVAGRLESPGGLRVVAEKHSDRVTEQTLRGTAGLEGRADARTFLAFTKVGDRPRLRACFVLCTRPTPACEDAMSLASVASSDVPPPPSVPLRAVVFAVHHPRAATFSLVALFFVAGIVAVWKRPRPRRK